MKKIIKKDARTKLNKLFSIKENNAAVIDIINPNLKFLGNIFLSSLDAFCLSKQELTTGAMQVVKKNI